MGLYPAVLRYWMSSTGTTPVCRLCWSTDSPCSELGRTIAFQTEGIQGNLNVYQILAKMLQIKNFDNLPHHICESCLDMLLKFFTFWQLCRRNEEQLEKQLSLLSDQVATLQHSLDIVDDSKTSSYDGHNSAILFQNGEIDYFNFNTELCKVNGTKSELQQIILKGRKRKTVIVTSDDNKIEKQYVCQLCPERFSRKFALTLHLRMHSREKRLDRAKTKGATKCSICNVVFESSDILASHVGKKHAEYKHRCTKCYELFRTESEVSHHEQNVHKYFCKVCGKLFRNYNSVTCHEEMHEGFVCERCGEKFDTRLKLQAHVKSCFKNPEVANKIMVGVKSYTCDYCGRTFYRKPTFRQHIETQHLYPRSVKCEHCDKRFSRKTEMTAHLVVHTRERSHQCHLCCNVFVTRTALKYHLRLHTGECPYACDICSEKFLSASRRMAHIQKEHLGKTVQCHICAKWFYPGYALKRHVQRHQDPSSTLFKNICVV